LTYDIAIIGGGITGTTLAYKLGKYQLKVALIEKGNDVSIGTTKANSAIVHAGYDAKPNSLKGKLNAKGAKQMQAICKELSVPYKQIGSLVVAFDDNELLTLKELLANGKRNEVEELEIISKEQLLKLEPNINIDAVGALLAKTGAIVCPYELSIAAAENAVINGTNLKRNFEVKGIEFKDIFIISSNQEKIKAKIVINAAGLYADKIAEMIGDTSFTIKPRRGEYLLLDKSVTGLVKHTIFQCPTKMGKGILVTPTVDNNILIGPTAEDIDDKENLSTTTNGLDDIINKSKKSIPNIPLREVITSFTGLRAQSNKGDFIIECSQKNKNFINVAGIESPGLASSLAIADYVIDLLKEITELKERSDYKKGRPEPVRFKELTNEKRKNLMAKNPAYGQVICRCEMVTEGEIIDAIRSPVGAVDLDGIKRRTRAQMGRCQGGFCGSKVMEILAKELKIPIEDITKSGGKSKILIKNK
jgi:glycerol-3-phosphate dehydrogenase